jgi:hypothetical protein
MRKSWVLMLVLNAFMLSSAWSKENVSTNGIGGSLKKAGDAVGSSMEKAGKAVAPEVSKAGNWVGDTLNKSGQKSDKANR